MLDCNKPRIMGRELLGIYPYDDGEEEEVFKKKKGGRYDTRRH